jgi:hypothetical protein
MIQPDHLFKNTLENHETPLGEAASFQGVMKKREKKRRAFFWFSLNSVLFLLISLSAASLWGPKEKDENEGVSAAQVKETANQRNPDMHAANVAEKTMSVENQTAVNGSSVVAAPNIADPINFTHNNLFIKRNVVIAGGQHQLPKMVETPAEVAENVNIETTNLAASSEVASTSQEMPYADWIHHLTGRGIASEYIFQIQPTEGTVLPEFVPFYPYGKPKFNPIFELNVTTAGNGYKYFRESKDVTVAGNHRYSQYHGMMLFDLGRGVNVGGGLGYMESVGIGKALISEWKTDTAQMTVRTTKAENIAYRMNKLSLPLGIRYQLGFGRSMVRIAATAMPGIITLANGKVFSRETIQSLDNMKKNNVSFDARLGVGLYYQVAPKTAISAEPMLQYQTIAGTQWKSFNRMGFGFGLGVVFKP